MTPRTSRGILDRLIDTFIVFTGFVQIVGDKVNHFIKYPSF